MIQIYNTLTRQKEVFKPLKKNEVNMYVCGMTVYDHCHLGHARALIVFDLIYRWLLDAGLQVNYVRNITDIDDKIIAKAKDANVNFSVITQEFIQSMNEDSSELNILPPKKQPKATESIEEMIQMISNLIAEEYAYIGRNGDVFFHISKFKEYGKLSKKTLEDLDPGSRVGLDENKINPLDFVLWKLSKPGEPSWKSPWGEGRPGWHIECSAMSTKYLGKSFDIHGGGQDLIFPHHENEIAQSECCNHQKMANYWVHNGFVNVDNEKMSKSLGNFFTIKKILEQFNGEVIRFFILKSHYRSPLNYSDTNLVDAENSLKKIYISLRDYNCIEIAIDWNKPYLHNFKAALDDDFNSPKALAVIFELINKLNKNKDQVLANEIFTILKKIGLLKFTPEEFLKNPINLDVTKIEELIKLRQQAKINKNFSQADQIRSEIESLGVVIEDSLGGTSWRKK
jgi:cysteinyl-tRNA synthetase